MERLSTFMDGAVVTSLLTVTELLVLNFLPSAGWKYRLGHTTSIYSKILQGNKNSEHIHFWLTDREAHACLDSKGMTLYSSVCEVHMVCIKR